MKLVEKIDVTKPVEPKWIRADSLWNEIANSSFSPQKKKKRFGFYLKMNQEAVSAIGMTFVSLKSVQFSLLCRLIMQSN